MKFDVISSGSKGNATLIYSKGCCIQIDFGISKRRICNALTQFELNFEDVEAFFISHGHSDHCSDIQQASKEKVYASSPSIPKFNGVISGEHLLIPYKSVSVGPFTITPIPLVHDYKNTIGFVVSDGEETLAYITDTGFVPEKNFSYLQNLDYYIFESNHDTKMLYESKRPDYLIRRIISDTGHLSNVDSAFYLSTFVGDKTKEIVLAHLSSECNREDLALETYQTVMRKQLGFVPEIKVVAASETHETVGGR